MLPWQSSARELPLEQHRVTDEPDDGYAEYASGDERVDLPGEQAAGENGAAAAQREPLAAMSIEEAHHSGDECCSWVGRIAVVRAPWGGVIYIGPHWYCSIIMLGLILGVGGLYTVGIATLSGVWHTLGGVAITSLSTFTFLRCVFANPGILKRQDAAAAEAGEAGLLQTESAPAEQRRRGRHCKKCNVDQPSGTTHCEFCDVCVLGHDHHCPWMGKCIGKGNLSAFYTFICTGFSSLGYIFIITVLSAPEPHHHQGYHRPIHH